MGFSVDFSELEKLVRDMKITQQDFNGFLYKFLLRMANQIVEETKLKQSRHYGDEFKVYDTGAMTNAWKLGEIMGSGKDITVVIENAAEYATEVEFGHRIVRGTGADKVEVGWKNGVFMMTTSINNVRRKMPAAYDTAFKAFCKEHGID